MYSTAPVGMRRESEDLSRWALLVCCGISAGLVGTAAATMASLLMELSELRRERVRGVRESSFSTRRTLRVDASETLRERVGLAPAGRERVDIVCWMLWVWRLV